MKRFSPEVVSKRLTNLPIPSYAEDLPVVARRAEIKCAISENQVVIVCGETGSGKTTQLPKICLELQRGVNGLIGHTQPRRIAARTVANRIASELKTPLGHSVGYKIRFSDQISSDTYIKLMTDGILLAETQGDPLLQSYDTLIIDEAHERSLNIDFLLGYISQILPQRPDLKLIITSATIDAQRFSRHFNNAPVIEVTGRMYPVEICYRPMTVDDEDQDIQRAILDAVDEVVQIGSGDILIFLPGEREIRETAESLRKHHFDRLRPGVPSIEILPLFARLSFADQDRVFKTGQIRRIVLATNVAETSLTVPGIHYVIDTGWARINRYSYRNKVEQLLVEKISRASANQRAGRCGRVASGVCVRLYSEEDFQARAEFTDPEILRSSLAAVILRMKSLKIGDVENFPFLESPAPRMISDGYQLLAELGAINEKKNLTQIGWRLAKFPIDPRVARMILAAKHENCLHEVLIIASALSLQDPRDRPFEHQAAADRAHLQFQDERSDFLGYLKLWGFFEELLKHKKSNRKLVAMCQENFLSHRRLREWREIHGQLHMLIKELGFKRNQIPAGYDEIHRALLAGLLGNIGFKTEKDGEYLGARGIKFSIFPGSVLKKGKAKWIVASELVETTKLFGRCAAKIDAAWIETIAGNLCKKHYSDPHWEKKQAQVTAFERVTLYGLTVMPKRRVHYGSINATESREIFIRMALVTEEYVSNAKFFIHNKALIKEIEDLEHKTRRQDVLVDEQEIFAFYDAIIPAGIFNGAGFEKWRKQAEQQNPKLLYLSREFLMRHQADHATEIQFPETMQQLADGSTLSLTYRFEPGHLLDGVTVSIPLALLNRLDAKQFDYLVPGLIREKVAWYLKALPKQIRRVLVPLPESVTQFLQNQSATVPTISLHEALAKFILRKTSISIPADVWENKDIPAHLLMNIRVIDDEGQELASSRNLEALQMELGRAAQLIFAKTDLVEERLDIERDNIKIWDFGDLPEEMTFTRNHQKLTGYPALVDQQESVAIRLFDTIEAAQIAMRAGLRRLLCFALKDRIKQLDKNLPGLKQAALQLASIINPSDLKQDMLHAITDRAFIGEASLPRNEATFVAYKQQCRIRLSTATEEISDLIQAIGNEYQNLIKALSNAGNTTVKAELNNQLRQLIYAGFLSNTTWMYLVHFPRYLKGMCVRLDKSSANPERDARHSEDIAMLLDQYLQRMEKHQRIGFKDPKLNEFRWQVEELRISLFAQELKTPRPVSIKRLQKLWEQVRE
jgi:ATP-dependent RNA helicase HrpA